MYRYLIWLVPLVGCTSSREPSTDASSPEATDEEAAYWFEGVYFVPADAPRDDRADAMVDAMRQIRRQWASWDFTYTLKRRINVVRSDVTCAELYSEDGSSYIRVLDEVVDQLGYRGNVKLNIFSECVTNVGVAASASGNAAIYYDGVLDGIESGFLSDVGAVGHEQGHLFNMPHENCDGEEEFNARVLRQLGLPDYGTRSLMCNGGNWPDVNPPEPWMVEVMTTGYHCRWFEECDDPDRTAPVTLFTDRDYLGSHQDFEVGRTNDLGAVGQRSASSIRIAPGYAVELCEMSQCWELTADEPRLAEANNRATRLVVTKVDDSQ